MTKSDWISVRDVLPPKDKLVLIYTNTYEWCVGRVCGENPPQWYSYLHTVSRLWDERPRVTYWRSLPDPPDTK